MDDVKDVLKHWLDILMTKKQIQSWMSRAKFLWFVPLVDISPHIICSPATMGLINGKKTFFFANYSSVCVLVAEYLNQLTPASSGVDCPMIK